MLLTSLSPGFRAMSRSGFSCTFDRSLTTQIRSCRMGPEVQGWQLETIWTMPKQREKKQMCIYIERERGIDVNVHNSCVYIYDICYILYVGFIMFHHVSRYQKGPCKKHVYFLLIYPSANWMFDPLQLQPLKVDRLIIIDYQDRLTIAARKAMTIQNMRWTWWKYVYGCFQK